MSNPLQGTLFGRLDTDLTGILSTASTVSSSGPLTEEDLHAAIKAVTEQKYEPHPCQLGQHMVSAAAKDRLRAGGTARCVECLMPLGPYPV